MNHVGQRVKTRKADIDKRHREARPSYYLADADESQEDTYRIPEHQRNVCRDRTEELADKRRREPVCEVVHESIRARGAPDLFNDIRVGLCRIIIDDRPLVVNKVVHYRSSVRVIVEGEDKFTYSRYEREHYGGHCKTYQISQRDPDRRVIL